MTPSAAQLGEYARDPSRFRHDLLIDANGLVVRLGDVIEPWQDDDFHALDGGWRRAIGHHVPDEEAKRGWLERPRGAAKTSDLAIMAVWALAFAPSQALGAAAAGDADQARLLLAGMSKLIDLNPWLSQLLDVQAWRVKNTRTGSTLEILSADASTAYGHLLDFLIVDEINNWPASGEQLWISLASTIAKRARAMCTVISNAGFTASWQYKLAESVAENPRWRFSHMDGHPSWITPELLAEQQRLLPVPAFRRLWLNVWASGTGDAIDPADLEAATVLAGPTHDPEKDVDYAIGVDLATKRDFCGVATLAGDWRRRKVVLVDVRSWKPGLSGTVNLQEVRDYVADQAVKFDAVVFADPFQAVLMLQQLQEWNIQCVEMPFTPANLTRMASKLLQGFREKRIELYPDPTLIDEFQRLSIVETQSGFRIKASRDSRGGHCDAATAFCVALPAALDHAMTYDPLRNAIWSRVAPERMASGV